MVKQNKYSILRGINHVFIPRFFYFQTSVEIFSFSAVFHLELLCKKSIVFDKVHDFFFRVDTFPEKFGMIANSVFIYGERNAIVGVGFAVMLNQVATWVFPDVFYPIFIITLAPFIILFSCQCHINTDRVVTGTSIGSKINNLCHNFAVLE